MHNPICKLNPERGRMLEDGLPVGVRVPGRPAVLAEAGRAVLVPARLVVAAERPEDREGGPEDPDGAGEGFHRPE